MDGFIYWAISNVINVKTVNIFLLYFYNYSHWRDVRHFILTYVKKFELNSAEIEKSNEYEKSDERKNSHCL